MQIRRSKIKSPYFIILFLVPFVVACVLCVAGGYYMSENVLPSAGLTRTALVGMFTTPDGNAITATIVTPEPTGKYVTYTPSPIPSPTALPTFPTPTFSPPVLINPPPGKIVYSCNQGVFDKICLMNADGSAHVQLTTGESTDLYPSFSPEGDRIIFTSRKDNHFELYEMNVGGDDITKLTENIGNIYSPEISPNGKRVVFTVKNDGIHSIWIMKRDGSNARPVSPANYSSFDPTWSPENDRIAFVSDLTDSPQLYIVHAGAEKIRQVTNGVQAIGEYVSWSPDGKGLAFVAGTIGNRQIFIVGIDGGDMRQLTNVGDNIAPSFSPDGQWITFTSNKAGSDDIYIMRMDGSEITRLSGREEADRHPGWGS